MLASPLPPPRRDSRPFGSGRAWPPHLGASLPRLFDILLSLILLTLLAPVLAARGLIAWRRTRRILIARERVGWFRVPFHRLAFAGNSTGASLPVLFNVLAGDMAFVGPRALSPEEAAKLAPEAEIRFSVRPGLFSPYTVRRKTGIAYDDESALDLEFCNKQSVRGNLGLILRGVLSSLLAGNDQRALYVPERFILLGVPIVNTTMKDAIDWIVGCCRSGIRCRAAFVNPDCLNIAYRHAEYRSVLNDASQVWPDGIGIKLGCRILGIALRENVNGTDLFPRLCERVAKEGLSLYLLGARPGIANMAGDNLQARFPALRISGARDGYFTPAEEAEVIEDINQSGADILLVAFGAPRQELWLAQHQDRLRPRVLLGVGGLFDFYSGQMPRAPVWMREIGLEWVWRLRQEPRRMWRRYIIGNPLFLYRVFRQQRQEQPQ